jgi:exopolyphosphatase/guanosine-5'-triphosphate,3'-diphosphate pyrophosphatase
MNLKKASIDIGSNSVLLLAAEMDPNFKVLLNESRVTALGRDLDKTKKFHPDSMSATRDTLIEYVSLCKKIGITSENIIVTATEAARVASNALEFMSEIMQELNLSVRVLSGEEEAYYSTKGILFNTKFEQDIITIMDIGGASTEIIKVNALKNEILQSFSMPLGSVRMTNWLSDGISLQKTHEIFKIFEKGLHSTQTSKLFCVAGTMTSLANMHLKNKTWKEDEVHGYKMNISDIQALKESVSHLSESEILVIYPFLEKRVKSIKGGIEVALTVLDWLNTNEVQISTYGLRYGTLLEALNCDNFSSTK